MGQLGKSFKDDEEGLKCDRCVKKRGIKSRRRSNK